MTTANNREAKEQALLAEELKDWRDKLGDAKNVAQQRTVVTDIIRAMSTGRDVSALFTDILKLMQTRDLKLKKLIYIFLTSNAQGNASQALLCVNALELDSQDRDSAMIRATAIRTMGSVATPDTVEYFTGSLARGLQDADPFVRKCAATCVAKLFKVKREAVEDAQLIKALRDAMLDGNQAVVSAAAGALIAIGDQLGADDFKEVLGCESEQVIFTQQEISALLTVLSQATEWSALSILQAISKHGAVPSTEEAEVASQRLQPFLRHTNPSVVLNAINVLLRYCKAGVLAAETMQKVQTECIGSVISLISQHSAPELQWVSLRSLRLVAKAFQGENPFQAIQRHIRLFFVRFNEELYVKLEKVEALALISNQETAFEVVKELAEYCEDVQPQFVRAAIRAIGQIACKVPGAADYCVTTYMTLLTGENEKGDKLNFVLPSYAAQELMVSIQDIFRTYPDRYERVIGALCEAIASYDDPHAKASLVWILGEYASRIEGADEILMQLMDIDLETQSLGTYLEDPVVIQLAMITAVAKIYVSTRTQGAQALFQTICGRSAAEAHSPDVRARAAFYQKLVQMDQSLNLASQVIFVQKPAPVYGDGLSSKVGEQLAAQLGSIPATLRELITVKKAEELDSEEVVRQFGGYEVEDIVTPAQPQAQPQTQAQVQPQVQVSQPVAANPLDDIFGDIMGTAQNQPKPAPAVAAPAFQAPVTNPAPVKTAAPVAAKPVANDLDDIFGLGSPAAQTSTSMATNPSSVQPQASQASQSVQQDWSAADYPFATTTAAPIRMKDSTYPIKLQVYWTRAQGAPALLLAVKNEAQFPVQGAQLQFMPNVFGFKVVNPTLPLVPAMGVLNGGRPHLMRLTVSQELCSFPAAKMGQLDPQLAIGMNTVSFNLQMPGGQVYQYQTKCPMHVALTEASPWHSQDRQLADHYQANIAINQVWNQYTEASESFQIPFQAVGANDFAGASQNIISRLHRGNFNYINIGQDCADYVMSSQLNIQSGVKQCVMFMKVYYQQGQQGLNLKVAVRAAPDCAIAASYALQGAVMVIQGK